MDAVSLLEIELRLKEESVDYINSFLSDVTREMEIMAAAPKEMRATIADIIKLTQNKLELVDADTEKAKLRLAIHKDDHEQQKMLLRTLEDLYIQQAKLLTDAEGHKGEHIPLQQIVAMKKYHLALESIILKTREAVTASSDWNKALKAVGLDKIVDNMKQWTTALGQIRFWSKIFQENADQAAKWKNQNYELYGSLQGIAYRIRNIATANRITVKDAQKAAAALGEVAIDPRRFDKLVGSIGRFSRATGASAETMAGFAKQTEALGFSTDSADEHMDALRRGMAKYGLTGRDADKITSFLNKNIRSMTASFGGSEIATKAAAKQMVALAGAAKAAGMSGEEVAAIWQTLTDNALEYIVLLGDGLNAADPGSMFLSMGANAQEALDSLDKIEQFWLKNEMAKAIYGMPYNSISKMNGMFNEFAESTMYKTAEALREAVRSGDMLEDTLLEDFNAWRDLNDPAYQFSQLMESLKQIFLDIMSPIMIVVNWILKMASALFKAAPWIKWVIGGLFGLMVVIKLVKAAFLSLAIIKGIGAGVTAMFSKLFGTVGSLGKALKNIGPGIKKAMKAVGEGIKGFADTLKNLNWKQIGKVVVLVAAIGVVLVGLAWVANKVGADKLIELSASIFVLALAIYALGKVGDVFKQSAASIFIGIGAIAALGGVLIVLGYAMGDMPPSRLLLLATALIAISGAMLVLAKAAPQIAKAKDDLIKAAVGLAAIGGAMIGMGYALKIAEGVSWGTMTIVITTLTAMAGILTGLGFVGKKTGMGMIIGAGAMVIFAAAIYVLALAMQEMPPLDDSVRWAQGLLEFAGFMLMAGGMLTTGAGPMIIGAAALVIALAIFWVASKFLKWSLQNIAEGANEFKGGDFHKWAKGVAYGLQNLAYGIDAIVGSHYILFGSADDWIENIGEILKVADRYPNAAKGLHAISTYFKDAMYAIKAGANYAANIDGDDLEEAAFGAAKASKWLAYAGAKISLAVLNRITGAFTLLKEMSTVSGSFNGERMIAMAKATGWSLYYIGMGFSRYSWSVQQSAERVAESIGKVTKNMVQLRNLAMSSWGENTVSNAVITVQAEFDDKQRENRFREDQNELLMSIRDGVGTLVAKLDTIQPAEGVAEKLTDITDLMEEFLPEIASGGKGLGSPTSKWHSSFG